MRSEPVWFCVSQRCSLYLTPSPMHFKSAGATAWDEEDGDLSSNILSCAPDSCMAFNCPGHESFRKGLSGCGINTVNGEVGSVLSLTFSVSDFSYPPATTTVQRLITVISPCKYGEIYCPELAQPAHPSGEHACGSTDCVSRAAILALLPVEPTIVAPSIEFSTAVPVSAVSITPPGSQSSGAALHDHAHTGVSQARFHSVLHN
jgi:hypothetical protein